MLRRALTTTAIFSLVSLTSAAKQIPLTSLAKGHTKSSTATITTHQGSAAVKLIPKHKAGPGYALGGPILFLDNTRFHNGAINVDVSGTPAPGAPEDARGFIGIAFRAQSDSRFEIIYLRPTNSHADDQLRRNHTTQYSSEPDWPLGPPPQRKPKRL